MKITVLLENTVCRDDMKCAHGLSMHIATDRHSILFDMGPNAMFLENAEKLGVDIAAVDLAFLSHAHDDHCGGLELFCKRNETAPVYLQENAWGEYYVVTPKKCAYIGLDGASLRKYRRRFRLAAGRVDIDEGVTLFSGGMGRDFWSHANDTLREKVGDDYPMDTFRHEQSLLVMENGKAVLFGGCAHNGVVNILRRAADILGHAPDAVFAGFHLVNPGLGGIVEPRELIEGIAKELAKYPGTRFYTGHCTGQEPFDILKETLGDRLVAMHTGSVFEI